MNNKLLRYLFIFCLFAIPAHAQTQVTDIQWSNAELSSMPSGYLEYSGKLYFAATSDNYGEELWVSDGSESNTLLFKDLNPGSGSSAPRNLLVLNNELYFVANDGISGQQLFKTDGTTGNIQKLTNFIDKTIPRLTLVNDQIFFTITETISDGGDGFLAIWKSNGTKAGTTLIKDKLNTWSKVTAFEGSCNGLFFFESQATDSPNYTKMWRSDGTPAGTYPLTSNLEGSGSGYNGFGESGGRIFSQHIIYNNNLYFVARGTVFGSDQSVGIMKTDGTVENTVPVGKVHEGYLINHGGVAELSGKLYFSFFEYKKNRLFIWETDGTATGTEKVYDKTAEQYFGPSNLIAHEGKLFFSSAGSSGAGTSLMSLDPQNDTVTPVAQLEVVTTKPYELFGGTLNSNQLFGIKQGLMFLGLNKPNFTNTKDFHIINLASGSSTKAPAINYATSFYLFNGRYYFSGYSSNTGLELWSADQLLENYSILKNINKGRTGIYSREVVALGNNMIFDTHEAKAAKGRELWQFNTNSQTASVLADINPGALSSDPSQLIKFKDKIYFIANQNDKGREIWSTDGTEAGTIRLTDYANNVWSSYPSLLTNQGEENLYFAAFNEQERRSYLMKTDGTTLTTVKDVGVNMYDSPLFIKSIVATENKVFFATEFDGDDLWVSNGTSEGTLKLKDFCNIKQITYGNGFIYFIANEYGDCKGEIKLWKSDGTVSGTKAIFESGAMPFTNIRSLYSYNNALYFVAYTEGSGSEVWKTDGTAAGTTKVKEIGPGALSGIGSPDFTVFNDKLYFAADDGVHGTELWQTDGTTGNTFMVADIAAGSIASMPRNLTPIGNKLYLNATTTENGSELLVTEGADVSLAAEMVPGLNHSDPTNIMLVNGKIYFMANTLSAGRQLWMLDGEDVTGIEEEIIKKSLTVFPNPASEYITFLYDKGSKAKVSAIELTDMQGKKQVSIVNREAGKINISHLSPGIYLLTFQIGAERVSKKFIKINQ
ncbi:T9SS type A sorting domain-containing protein [Pontibacter sp. KCTC 32443]|uniref:ELWxxDGT repeat protein n=1 Tax=Pontibacter TaxID=323449 RepID=UPI00164E5FC8|nr:MULTISPECIES: ELWxxDGT repeat protein [Pontibacter]MBC5772571.1 T9SS type A sorting domain-containing protein [Pontibacter sp. KCTC 32443]